MVKFRGRIFSMPADQPWAYASKMDRLYNENRYNKILNLKEIEVKNSDVLFLDLDDEVLHTPFNICHGIDGKYEVLRLSEHPDKDKGFLFKYPSSGGHKTGDAPYEPGGSYMMAKCDQPIWVDRINKQIILFAYTINKMV